MKIKKIIIGTVLAGATLLSVGITFAFSDPGTKLSKWYHHQFEAKAQNIANSMVDKLSSSVKQLKKEMEPIPQRISKAIDVFQSNKLQDTTHTINEHTKHSISQLHTVTETLKEENEEQMQAYTEQKKQQETEQVSGDVQDILQDVLKD